MPSNKLKGCFFALIASAVIFAVFNVFLFSVLKLSDSFWLKLNLTLNTLIKYSGCISIGFFIVVTLILVIKFRFFEK